MEAKAQALRELKQRRVLMQQRVQERAVAAAAIRTMNYAAMASPWDAAADAHCPPERLSELIAAADAAVKADLRATGRLKLLRDSASAKSLGAVHMVNEATGESMLHAACWSGNAAAVQLLIDAGCDVNRFDSVQNKVTPLHEAARAGWSEIVTMLIAAGADIDAVDTSGDLPLHVACRAQQRWAMEALLLADAVRWSGVDADAPQTTSGSSPDDAAAAAAAASGGDAVASVVAEKEGDAVVDGVPVTAAAAAAPSPEPTKEVESPQVRDRRTKRAARRKAAAEEKRFAARVPTLIQANGKGHTAKELVTRWRSIRVVKKFTSAPYWNKVEADWATYAAGEGGWE